MEVGIRELGMEYVIYTLFAIVCPLWLGRFVDLFINCCACEDFRIDDRINYFLWAVIACITLLIC